MPSTSGVASLISVCLNSFEGFSTYLSYLIQAYKQLVNFGQIIIGKCHRRIDSALVKPIEFEINEYVHNRVRMVPLNCVPVFSAGMC